MKQSLVEMTDFMDKLNMSKNQAERIEILRNEQQQEFVKVSESLKNIRDEVEKKTVRFERCNPEQQLQLGHQRAQRRGNDRQRGERQPCEARAVLCAAEGR